MSWYSVFALVAGIHLATAAFGDQWPAPTKSEWTSLNGHFVLTTTPASLSNRTAGKCAALLERVDGENRSEVWRRDLINNIAPVECVVSDSGRYVATMDEWHAAGTLPIVIYGPNGYLAAVHNLESLGLRDDDAHQHISRSVSSYWWSGGAIAFFGKDDQTFIVRLQWGRWIVIDMRTGDLRTEAWFQKRKKPEDWSSLMADAKERAKQAVVRYLDSAEVERRTFAAKVAGELQAREAIPKLKELLNDSVSFHTSTDDEPSKIVYPVRQAAADALRTMGQDVTGVVTEEQSR